MTILKFVTDEKKIVNNSDTAEVVADLLKQPNDNKALEDKFSVTVESVATRKLRHRRALCIFLLISGLLFIACAAVGGYYLHCHFSHQEPEPWSGYCSTDYYNTPGDEILNKPHRLQEKIEVAGLYERIHVPKFDECDASLILHDFIYNYTAIVDGDRTMCFVMQLNRSLVVPPEGVTDLIKKMWTGYYHPKVRTLRERYIVHPRQVDDVATFGRFVAEECSNFKTFRLINYRTFLKKMRRRQQQIYGYYGMTSYMIKVEVNM